MTKKTNHPWRSWPLLAVALAWIGLAGCEPSEEHPHPHPHDEPGESATSGGAAAEDDAADHGEAVELGTVTVAGRRFEIVRFGEVTPGVESAFEVHGVDVPVDELARLNLYLWVEDESGTQLSAPAKGDLEGDGLHFHAVPRAGRGEPHRIVLRVRADGTDERAGLPLDGHGHEHDDEGPHHGLIAPFSGAGAEGYLELKLHDDKGDLELWLAKDRGITEPFDLPLDTEVEVEFIDVDGRTVTLRPRDRERNEDEDGTPNIRDGRTHYFIHPSLEGEDASWLQGKEFSSIVQVRFLRAGETVQSEEFVLRPHEH